MQLVVILLIFLMASAGPQPGLTQTSGGPDVPQVKAQGLQASAAPSLQHDVGVMAEMMRDIHQLLHQGPLTPKQAGQVSDIMTRLGVMMQEISGPRAEKYQSQHQRQLQEMKKQLEEIKNQLKSQKR